MSEGRRKRWRRREYRTRLIRLPRKWRPAHLNPLAWMCHSSPRTGKEDEQSRRTHTELDKSYRHETNRILPANVKLINFQEA